MSTTGRSQPQKPRLGLLCQELFELDNRFAELGEGGLFARLEQAGVLDHQLPELGDVRQAMRHAPTGSRAWLRGQFVERHARQSAGYWCDWTSLWDGAAKQQAELLDPFCATLEWKAWKPGHFAWANLLHPGVESEIADFRELLAAGCPALALAEFAMLPFSLSEVPPTVQRELLMLLAQAQSRCGLAEATATLDRALARGPLDLPMVSAALHTFLYLGLVPHPNTADWVERGQALLERQPQPMPEIRAAFLAGKGCWQNRTGQAAQALNTLSEAARCAQAEPSALRLVARIWAELGEAHRLTGQPREARYWLRRARRLHDWRPADGDLGNFTLLYLAKLESSWARAGRWLKGAEQLLSLAQDAVGELRCCLLQARFVREPSHLDTLHRRVLRIRNDLPGLQSCPKLIYLLEHWADWAGGRVGADAQGDFFWGI